MNEEITIQLPKDVILAAKASALIEEKSLEQFFAQALAAHSSMIFEAHSEALRP